MRRRVCAMLLGALCLCACVLTVCGSDNPSSALVSRSYLEGGFWDQLVQLAADRIAQARGEVAAAAEELLDELGRGRLEQLGQDSIPAGMEYTSAFVRSGGERHDTVSLLAGSGLIWHSGSGAVNGKLIDLTTGAESASLTPGHRYLAEQNAVITVSSLVAYWSVEGIWVTTSDGVSIKDIPFTDVKQGSWYYENVVYVYNRGLFNGTSSTSFTPDGNIFRDMLSAVLYRMAGSPSVTGEPPCADIETGKWYSSGACWAVSAGIMEGMVDDGLFHHDLELKREEIALMLYHYAQWLGRDTSQRADLTAFSDSDKLSSTAAEAMSWAVSLRIFRGGDGKLGPGDPVTRSQVAALLERFEEWLG